MNEMMALSNGMVAVPAGKYVIGDPCYAVPRRLWGDLLDTCEIFERPVGYLEIPGKKYYILAFGTAHGDGVYTGSDNFKYGVDAGLIGLVPYELAVQSSMYDPDLSNIIEFESNVMCTNEGGYMVFGHVTIDTSSYQGEYDDEYEEEEE